jgi:hypothetical protein
MGILSKLERDAVELPASRLRDKPRPENRTTQIEQDDGDRADSKRVCPPEADRCFISNISSRKSARDSRPRVIDPRFS